MEIAPPETAVTFAVALVTLVALVIVTSMPTAYPVPPLMPETAVKRPPLSVVIAPRVTGPLLL